MQPALQRKLLRELKAIKAEGRKDYTVSITPGDLSTWGIALFGAEKTDWDGAALRLKVKFPAQYPMSPPDVQFTGVIPFHPNVYANGKICLDLLQHNWSAAYGIDAIITSIQTLLVTPNPNSPANATAAEIFTKNFPEYRRYVRKCVQATWA
jgi:ubiquitin-conjugating enzyme E2 A